VIAHSSDHVRSEDVAFSEGGVAGAPVLKGPDEHPRFPLSSVLGTEAVEEMMAVRYGTVIGILGDPEAGKTACLVSLYLLIARNCLDNWSFSDSHTLMGFEQISRGARHWVEGTPPEQLTVHTELADHRVPGFLHLRLRHRGSGKKFDFLLPDLPGEWTKTLANTADTDRLEFLRSADVIWLMSDGRQLINKEARQGVIHRLGIVAARLAEMLKTRKAKIILVLTHRDFGEVDEATIDQIRNEITRHCENLQIIAIASFSDSADVEPGYGLANLIGASALVATNVPLFWPSSPINTESRAYLSFRSEE
jgi:hypothetical protein